MLYFSILVLSFLRYSTIVEESRGVLCAFGGPEGLPTIFGKFKDIEQDKICGKSPLNFSVSSLLREPNYWIPHGSYYHIMTLDVL